MLKVWRPLLVALGLMLAVAVGFAIPHLDDPREGLCEQGGVLNAGRLLDRANEVFARAGREGEQCGELGRLATGARIDAAADAFSEAGVRAAVKPRSADAEVALAETAGAETAAIDLYVDGLEIDPFDAGANAALAALLAKLPAVEGGAAGVQRCRLAGRLVRAGQLGSAAAVVSTGLSSAPLVCEAVQERLNGRRGRGAAHLRRAQDLGADGERRRARQRYALALRADPSLAEARAGLENAVEVGSVADAIGRRLGDVPGTLKNALSWFVPLAIGMMLAVLLARIGLTELAKRRPGARRRLIDWGEKPGLSFLRSSAVPRISVADFSGGESPKGDDFSALLASALPRPGREPSFPFDRIGKGSATDAQAASGTTELLEAFTETKLLGSVLKIVERLYRRRSIVVGGHLTPVADRGAGVSVNLEGADVPAESSIALWERDFDPLPGGDGAGRWLRLVPAATVWTRWQLAAAYAPDGGAPAPDGWMPDALFQAGVAWHSQGDLVRAGALFAAALDRDPDLLAAAHNLAMVELRVGRYTQARRLLLSLRSRLAEDEAFAATWPDLDTASLYALAVAETYIAMEGTA